MILEQADDPQDLPAKLEMEASSTVCVLCLPARDEADAIAGLMLAQSVATPGCLVESVTVTPTAGELTALVERCKADVICVSATPPNAVMHARHLCKQLRVRVPKLPLVVGLWNAQADLVKARTRIGCGDSTHVVATLAEAQEQVRLLIQPLLPPPEKPAEADGETVVMEEVHS
jgi:hypothetical protein